MDPAGGPDPGADSKQDALPVEEVRALFVTLGKAFRAHQLYEENNPVRQRFAEILRGEFVRLWTEVDRLVLTVDEHRIWLGTSEVYHSESRNDSLAFLFFKDGVREITFLPGIRHEVDRLLTVLQRARRLVPEGDDLLTVLWEEELRFFQYRYVDLLAEGLTLPEAGPGRGGPELQAALAAEQAAIEEPSSGSAADSGSDDPRPVRQDDFKPTLYALDPHEMATLRAELDRELGRDTRADVLNALFDRLEEPENRARQTEVLGILETLLPSFLRRGELAPATDLLRELRRLEGIPGMFEGEQRAASHRILNRISERAAVAELIAALRQGSIRASPEEFGAFVQFLQGDALGPLLRQSEVPENKELQAILRAAVRRLVDQDRAAVVALLGDGDARVVAAAARVVGQMNLTEAGAALAGVLRHDDPAVRLAAVEAAVALRASTVAGALEHTLQDPDRDVRIAAARALGQLRYAPASGSLSALLRSRTMRAADISEKVAIFEAFGLVAKENGVDLLDEVLNRKGFLGRREAADMRAAAALGLGRIGTNRARQALERAARDEDPVVRSNVNRALRYEG
jgi:HEAT repeat protein